MKKSIKYGVALLAAMFALMPATSMADEATYSYDKGNGTLSTTGTQKKENYDVAIRVEAAGLDGAQITKVRVPLTGVTNISNLKVWIASSLDLSKSKPVTDILSQDATAADGWVDVTLSTPYTLSGSDVYVGYSFDVDELATGNLAPVWITSEGTGTEGGLWMHSSRTYRKWMDNSAAGCSAMQVIVSGVKANAASFASVATINGQVNSPVSFEAKITNHGSAGISSFDYTYEVNGQKASQHVDLANAVQSLIGAYATQTVTLPAISTKGAYTVKLTVDKVNGVANEDATPTTEATLNIYNTLPVHRSVMEEYTGTWCGYCPRGFVGLEVMNKLYPDFIGLSYHNGDDMEVMSSAKFPADISGFPSAFLDRTTSVDAYYGIGYTKEMGIADAWKDACAVFAPFAISVKAGLNEDNTKVIVGSEVVSPLPLSNANYKMEIVLVANDLYNESWGQSNYYSGYGAGYFQYEEFDKFTTGESYVYGLHFDDVVVATTRLSGNDVILPSEFEEDKAYEANAEFTLANIVNTSGAPVIQDNGKLRAVALLIDRNTGAIVNANKCNVSLDPTGIKSVEAKTTNGEAQIYDLSGRRINTMVKGVNIVKTADGRTVKVMHK